MVFQAIGFWLLVLAIPLWAYRWYLVSALDPRERNAFRRLIKQRHEHAVKFGTKVFGYLILIAVGVMTLVFSLTYLKHGAVRIGSYRETMRGRLYSGLDTFDNALDTFHYDQVLPVAVITTCLVLSIGFTLVTTALRDMSVIRQLKRRIASLAKRSGETTT
ncbi:MAG: hypothetical protein ABJQ71_13835 [Roseibium sp.]